MVKEVAKLTMKAEIYHTTKETSRAATEVYLEQNHPGLDSMIQTFTPK